MAVYEFDFETHIFVKKIQTMITRICCFSLLIAFFACSNQSAGVQDQSGIQHLGEKFDAQNVFDVEKFVKHIEKKGGAENIQLKAKINSCCQKKGCWMNVDLQNGEEMMVRFKDYGFFVPLNSAQSWVVMRGDAYIDTVSVEDLRHYAQDGGASSEEIEKITEPEIKLSFLANGLQLLP